MWAFHPDTLMILPKTYLLIAVSMLVGAPAISAPQGRTQQPRFLRTTVEAILRLGKRIDGKPVELHGRIVYGGETSIFVDASTCGGMKVSGCSIWAEFDDCRVVGGESAQERCGKVVDQRSRPLPAAGGSSLLVLDDVTVRGIVLTVRKDVHYDKSVPKSLRIGFGHLSAYPAQINVGELEIGGER
jgi:hypothetical protein